MGAQSGEYLVWEVSSHDPFPVEEGAANYSIQGETTPAKLGKRLLACGFAIPLSLKKKNSACQLEKETKIQSDKRDESQIA